MKKFLKILLISIGIIVALLVSDFFWVQNLDAKEPKILYTSNYAPGKPVLLPSVFINGERFYIKMQVLNGDTALGYCDTGGGTCMLNPTAIDKLNLQSKLKHALFKGIMPVKYVEFRDVVKDESIPSPIQLSSRILRRPFSRVTESFLLIPPMDDELKLMTQVMSFDLFLGQNFFMGKAWTLDYPKRQIWVNTNLPASEEGKPGIQKLGFKKNDKGENIYGHPSMTIEVNGEEIDVLFDTGATIILSEDGKKDFDTKEKTIGGSFIAASIFEKWKREHPDWKYFEKADMNRDIIEVPVIKVGGNEIGPVLFAKRPDEAWSQYMIGSMDKVVKGAIGGSALKYLKVTIDYNSELAKFEK